MFVIVCFAKLKAKTYFAHIGEKTLNININVKNVWECVADGCCVELAMIYAACVSVFSHCRQMCVFNAFVSASLSVHSKRFNRSIEEPCAT